MAGETIAVPFRPLCSHSMSHFTARISFNLCVRRHNLPVAQFLRDSQFLRQVTSGGGISRVFCFNRRSLCYGREPLRNIRSGCSAKDTVAWSDDVTRKTGGEEGEGEYRKDTNAAVLLVNEQKDLDDKVSYSHGRLLESLSAKQFGQIALFVDTLLDWNQRMNLTAVTNREAVMERHIGDSLSLLPIIEEAFDHSRVTAGGRLRIVDVGTGAGLPGIVLAIARPAWQVILLESLRKRCNFLEHVVGRLDLTNVEVQWDRAENAGRSPLRESCHVAVARAVAELRVLAELCIPLLCVGGVLVAPKGPNPQEELESAVKAIRLLGGDPPQLIQMGCASSGAERTVIVSVKKSITPPLYPRRAGTPSKKPL